MTPLPDCKRSVDTEKGKLAVTTSISKPLSGKMTWKLSKIDAVSLAEIGDPVNAGTSYAVCLYDAQASLLFGARVLSGANWTKNEGKLSYKDKLLAQDGVKKLKLTANSIAGKSSLSFTASNKLNTMASIGEPPYADLPLTVQMVNSVGTCWSAEFATADKNEPGRFKAKGN